MSPFEKLQKSLADKLDREVAPWSPALASHLRELARPCLALVPTTRGKQAACFGGPTLLPEGTAWPTNAGGEHLDYLGYLDLSALADVGSSALDAWLPSRGVLSVFIEHLSSAAEPVVVRCIHSDVGVDALVERSATGSRTTAGRSLWISLPGLVIASAPMMVSIVVGALARKHDREDDS
jgi:hypothetical protein